MRVKLDDWQVLEAHRHEGQIVAWLTDTATVENQRLNVNDLMLLHMETVYI